MPEVTAEQVSENPIQRTEQLTLLLIGQVIEHYAASR